VDDARHDVHGRAFQGNGVFQRLVDVAPRLAFAPRQGGQPPFAFFGIARRAVIEAEKENAILEQELNREKALAAAELAKAELAQTILLAQIYQDNPAYFNYLVAQINASAIKETDKVMILPEGTIPNLVLGRDILPVTNVDGSSFIEP